MTPCPFVIATSARAGGNFLMDLLTSTGKVGRVVERLQPYRRLELSDAEIELIFSKLYEEATLVSERTGHTSPDWGLKVDIRDLFVLEHYLRLYDIKPRDVKWIWLKRRDKAKQALSYMKAIESGQWHLTIHDSVEDFEKDKTQIDIDMSYCRHVMLKFFIIEDTWSNFFRVHGIEPHVLYYEDYIDELTWGSTVAGIFDFVGIPYELPLDVSSEHIRRSENVASSVYEELRNMTSDFPWHYTFFNVEKG